MPVQRSDRKTTAPMPQGASLNYSRTLSAVELAHVREGHAPRDMDDKWFCFVENDRLYMHRSWTGNEMFVIELQAAQAGGAEATNLVRNADRTQFKMADEAALDLFDGLLARLAAGWP